MIDISTIDYSALDRPDVSGTLFHPRSEGLIWGGMTIDRDVFIPVDAGVKIGGCFHTAGLSAPCILFFHGNGEIVADYDDLAGMYNQRGINFLAVDYRGYGRSDGRPSATSMVRDAHMIFDFTRQWLRERKYTGPLIVMGRSLGSASALELASHYGTDMDGLIVESGFAWTLPLLELLGTDIDDIGLSESDGFGNIEKIKNFAGPLLVIHAEQDHIIPFSDGQDLYDACASADKTLLRIPNANHNDLLYAGFDEYMAAVEALAFKSVT